MLGHQLLHKLLEKSLPFIHTKRMSVLFEAVHALMKGKKLSLTLLGRNLNTKSKERHNIRKMDRLLGNHHLHGEIDKFYSAINQLILHNIKQPIISVDWSCVNKRKDWHILRASVVIKGRPLVVYQQVHPKGNENSPKVEQAFLKQLKALLPASIVPIIITDAGFRGPWFKAVQKLGFDWVGRVRNQTNICLKNHKWTSIKTLYQSATAKPTYLGYLLVAKANSLLCHVVLYKKVKQGRVHINRSGKRTNNNASNRCARRETDPWLLVTSLDVTQLGPKKIAAIYAYRMQIEQDFRDTKSHQFGFALRYSLTNQQMRLQVLLLIATLAALACWLISIAAKQKNLHYDYQANSTKQKTILSVIYLACQLVRRNVQFSQQELLYSFSILHSLISDAFLGETL